MTVAAGHWNSWHPERPAALHHLPSGLTLTPLLYSARAQATCLLPPGPDISFGERTLDGKTIRFDSSFADTLLAWRYDRDGAGSVRLQWRCHGHGEWGLRYWVVLCLQGNDETAFAYDEEDGRLQVRLREGLLEVRAAKDPLLVTYHDDLGDLAREFREKGYFYLASRDRSGALAALRFNLEEAHAMEVHLRIAADAQTPLRRPGLPGPAVMEQEPPGTPGPQAALQAVHDVMAWNHAYDFINARPYTLLTRFWNQQKFGGFGVWLNDVLYNAMMWGLFDRLSAQQNLEAVFAWQTDAGNFPCLVTGNDAWLDRSQPPIAAFILWSLYLRSGNPELLRHAYPKLLRNFDWWWRCRRLGESGLVAYGTSPKVGRGLYKGTKLAAKDESSMDNSPLHDPAPFDSQSGLLLSADVGLNALLALEGEILAKMARELGFEEDAARLEKTTREHKSRIATDLWDAERRVFANRLYSGAFVEALAPTSFYPLAAGAADGDQIEALLTGYLENPAKFGGDPGLPSVARDHPSYRDNVYWRGRIWGPLNFWVYQGLVRAGRSAEAGRLAEKSWRLFAAGWESRLCGENYNAESGAILDQADTDGFYSWGALLPLLVVSEVCDATPWEGLSLAPANLPLAQQAAALGPLLCPAGPLEIRRTPESWQVLLHSLPFLEGTLEGRLTQVAMTPEGFSAHLPSGAGGERLAFPNKSLQSVRLGGKELAHSASQILLPPRPEVQGLVVTWRSEDV